MWSREPCSWSGEVESCGRWIRAVVGFHSGKWRMGRWWRPGRGCCRLLLEIQRFALGSCLELCRRNIFRYFSWLSCLLSLYFESCSLREAWCFRCPLHSLNYISFPALLVRQLWAYSRRPPAIQVSVAVLMRHKWSQHQCRPFRSVGFRFCFTNRSTPPLFRLEYVFSELSDGFLSLQKQVYPLGVNSASVMVESSHVLVIAILYGSSSSMVTLSNAYFEYRPLAFVDSIFTEMRSVPFLRLEAG